ncbi:BREX-2 system adenine-specific DNA-methyltransferase PglX [Corynebacterium sp. J010B-136]|uniref:BREX-2 system adenine-specific DNA-methyltransferase PglX n=1 Tax=Corynebacterium sp. J010B-136 TaxID=2099401 RepID=UPI000CF8F47E|nr:BREX-2 system adenine-specific DNA-methyltransferase PglX [Corynebacterium sp. J010B-136]PQM73913.1 DNA methylase [Corynebacterium sp. J010B-136]
MSQQLTRALQPIVNTLVDDMRERLHNNSERLTHWRKSHQDAEKAERTASSYSEWENEQLQQAAVGWVLTSVFIRFIEDNSLFGESWAMLSGHSDEARRRARDHEDQFYAANPDQSYRGYLQHVYSQLGQVDATRALVDDYAGYRIMEPSERGAREIIDFWRAVDSDGKILWSLKDNALSTRFLGDMYQDLSEYARKRYALLQTPGFVEEFILERTLTPALEERPLEGFTLIDPTCGSGHFLLGAFEVLVDRWEKEAPGLDARERAVQASKAIHGVDINPFAVAISRFRLIVSFMKASGEQWLSRDLPKPDFTVISGDSLYWGPGSAGLDAIPLNMSKRAVGTEDLRTLIDVLAPARYDVVIGNPPYITVKDKALNAFYRERYSPYCKRTYAMTAPSMVMFFALARDKYSSRGPGWVGQITSNSFEKREFGAPLIEKFLPTVDLREVIDSSGAYVPGHGTPTVILVGRNAPPSKTKVRGILGIQGEPGIPKHAEDGLVWRSIVEHVDDLGFENDFISVREMDRDFIGSHPWNLQGGAAPEISNTIERHAGSLLQTLSTEIGRTTHTGMDPAYFMPIAREQTHGLTHLVPLITGDTVRDFCISIRTATLFPYDKEAERRTLSRPEERHFWPLRKVLSTRQDFGETPEERGLRWFDHSMFFPSRYRRPLGITFAFVATHNHFVLDRGGKVFNRSAPVIKLRKEATEDDHFALLGVLNSSVACFWLRQNSHNKGSTTDSKGARTTLRPWENFYEFTGTTLKEFPLPEGAVSERGRQLDTLATELATWDPTNLVAKHTPTPELLDQAQAEYTRIRELMIAEQEELDWSVYYLYGLTETDLSLPVGAVTGLPLGARPFEITLARSGRETAWFDRHHSTPVVEIPKEIIGAQRETYQKRLALISNDRLIKLLEAPEYKRRWSDDLWEDKVKEALESWLLTRLESQILWFDDSGKMPITRTIRELAGVIETDQAFAEVLDVLQMWSTKRNRSTVDMLVELFKGQAVPFHKELRYKKPGLRKRAEWEETWAAQRREDAGEISPEEVPVPPNYTTADMYPAVWKHRGKLDVPKERFISYPGTLRADDPTEVLGWAGWNHLQQGLALVGLTRERLDADAEPSEIAGLLSGMNEQLPWIMMWHNDPDPELGLRFGDYLKGQVTEVANQIGVPVEDLDNYAPQPTRKTRTKKGR